MQKQLDWIQDGEVQLLSINNGYAPMTPSLDDILAIQNVVGSFGRDAFTKIKEESMKPIAVVAVMMLLSGPLQAQTPPPLEFKGIMIGMTEDQVKANGASECHSSKGPADRFCMPPFTAPRSIAGVSASLIMVILYDNRALHVLVTFEPKDLKQVSDAVIEKYGPPKTDQTAPLTTRAGTVFENRTMVWNMPDGIMTVQRYSGRIDRALFELRSHDWEKVTDQRSKDATKKNKTDL